MNPYVKEIMQLLRCSETDARMVEHIMREDIFHSTLEWQSAGEFRQGARKAWRMLNENRADYEEHFRLLRDRFNQDCLARGGVAVPQPAEVSDTDELWEEAPSDEPDALVDQKQTILSLVVFREHRGETIVQGCRFHLAPCADGQWFVWAEAHQPPEAPEPCDAFYDFFDGIGKAFASRTQALRAIYEYGSEFCLEEAEDLEAEPEAVVLR